MREARARHQTSAPIPVRKHGSPDPVISICNTLHGVSPAGLHLGGCILRDLRHPANMLPVKPKERLWMTNLLLRSATQLIVTVNLSFR